MIYEKNMTWDFQKIKQNRNKGRIPVKAFRGSECRPFKSIRAASRSFKSDPETIKNHIATGRELKGYVFEWG